MKVVGLAGRSGVGKSTLSASYLRPLGFMEVALADEIKIRAIATGVATYEQVFIGAKPPHVRTWLQEEGTERGRMVFGQDVWARALFARMRKITESSPIDKFVVTDVRFVNEVEYIRSHGGIVLRVDAPERNRNNGMTEAQRQHASETNLDGLPESAYDGLILNDPEYEHTVAWQLHAHLFLRRFVTDEYRGNRIRIQEKAELLSRILPGFRRA